MGVPIRKPDWYKRRETNAVLPGGTQARATCGLHAFNHTLHVHHGFRSWTWAEFDARVHANEYDANGNWEFAALQTNIEVAGASIEPVLPDDLSHIVTWIDGWNRLRVWQPNTFGLLLHIPGHWIVIVRPEGTSTIANVATLCDSLYSLPCQLSHAEITQMMTGIQTFLRQSTEVEAGQWSVYRVFQ